MANGSAAQLEVAAEEKRFHESPPTCKENQQRCGYGRSGGGRGGGTAPSRHPVGHTRLLPAIQVENTKKSRRKTGLLHDTRRCTNRTLKHTLQKMRRNEIYSCIYLLPVVKLFLSCRKRRRESSVF